MLCLPKGALPKRIQNDLLPIHVGKELRELSEPVQFQTLFTRKPLGTTKAHTPAYLCPIETQPQSLFLHFQVASRVVVLIAALWFMLFGSLVKFGAVFLLIPKSILGGIGMFNTGTF